MSAAEEKLLFNDETGCLTSFALQSLMDGSLEELERLAPPSTLAYLRSAQADWEG